MAENVIKTRIALKVDSLTNWQGSDFNKNKEDSTAKYLKKGEVAFATLTTTQTDANGNVVNVPCTLIKVGDGATKFDKLPWVSALAADVYDWAKKSENDFVRDFLTLKMTDGATIQTKLDAVFATDTELTNAISGLKNEITTTLTNYYTKAEVNNLFATLREEIALPEGGFASKAEFDALKGKVEDEDGALAKANDAYALAGTKSIVTTSSTNGKLGLNGSDITVYDDTALTNRVGTLEGKTDLGDFTNNAGYAKTTEVEAVAEDVTEINNELNTFGDIVTHNAAEFATDSALQTTNNEVAAIRSIAEAARTETEVNGQIDAKIAALNLANTYEPKGAEQNAKNYVDQKFTDANLSQYTTEQEVKDIVDGVISAAADVETTLTGLTELVDYIEKHGGDASAMATDIGTLKGKVEVIEKKPAYEISATDISNWNGEIGAKAAAVAAQKTADDYVTAHANDYTNKQIDDAIDADVKAAIDAEVIRANGAYEPIGAEGRATAAAKAETQNQITALTTGTINPLANRVKAIEDAPYATKAQVDAKLDANGWTSNEAKNGWVYNGTDKTATLNPDSIKLEKEEFSYSSSATLGVGDISFVNEEYGQNISYTSESIRYSIGSAIGGGSYNATGELHFPNLGNEPEVIATTKYVDDEITDLALGTMSKENAADYTKSADLGDLATKDKVASTDFADEVFIFDCGSATEVI